MDFRFRLYFIDCCFLGLSTVVKLVDRDILLKEREEKKRVSKIKTIRVCC